MEETKATTEDCTETRLESLEEQLKALKFQVMCLSQYGAHVWRYVDTEYSGTECTRIKAVSTFKCIHCGYPYRTYDNYKLPLVPKVSDEIKNISFVGCRQDLTKHLGKLREAGKEPVASQEKTA